MTEKSTSAIAIWVAMAIGLTCFAAVAAPAEEPGAGSATPLEQGWSAERREQFYFTAQGSRLAPYAWALALEQPDSTERFFSDAHVSRLGYLPAPASTLNPDALPIGFVKDTGAPGPNGPALGLTCAACHTAEISYRDKRLRIDGGASLGDFESFMRRLLAAFGATLGEPDKFERFAKAVGAEDPVSLRAAVEAYAQRLSRLNAGNATETPYGHGRIDAFGHILNAVVADALGRPDNLRPPDAPVSVPFLWTTPHQRYVQWNGVATNPYGRNVGEVMGVFGDIVVDPASPLPVRSSALGQNLFALENWVAELKPPAWPADVFGAPDPGLVEKGKTLYVAHCSGCHGGPAYRYTDASVNPRRRLIDVRMVSQRAVGTDPTMADNFAGRMAATGAAAPFVAGAQTLTAGRLLATLVGAAVAGDFKLRGLSDAEKAAYSGFRFSPTGMAESGWDEPAYKAGPLAGVWATGPFLHNGSVPTIYDLLSPEHERPTAFWVGSTVFDPDRLGFVSSDAELPNAAAEGLSRFDVALPGNSNRGHAYPVRVEGPLTPEERLAVIAFLKTLEGPDVAR